jgi:hypothetical protein
MAKGANTFTTMDSRFDRTHENFSSCDDLIDEDAQSMDRKEWRFYCVIRKQSMAAVCVHSSVRFSLVK